MKDFLFFIAFITIGITMEQSFGLEEPVLYFSAGCLLGIVWVNHNEG